MAGREVILRSQADKEEALREAACAGDYLSVQTLIHKGANVNAQHSINKWTALHWAAHRNHVNVIQILLASGADPSLEDSQGRAAASLVKSDDAKAAFQAIAGVDMKTVSNATATPAVDFVPNYLRHPDFPMAKRFVDMVETPVAAARPMSNGERFNQPGTPSQAPGISTNQSAPGISTNQPAPGISINQPALVISTNQPAGGNTKNITQGNSTLPTSSIPPEIMNFNYAVTALKDIDRLHSGGNFTDDEAEVLVLAAMRQDVGLRTLCAAFRDNDEAYVKWAKVLSKSLKKGGTPLHE